MNNVLIHLSEYIALFNFFVTVIEPLTPYVPFQADFSLGLISIRQLWLVRSWESANSKNDQSNEHVEVARRQETPTVLCRA